jgi:uncharacterized protein (DUF2249 family)
MSASSLELDVRVISPRDKHPTIFRTFDALASGQAMVIVNDHDPRRLRDQFTAQRPDAFDWMYEEEGPEVWRVRISRR